jgi:copper oxidase (laccase) domain-containing protein
VDISLLANFRFHTKNFENSSEYGFRKFSCTSQAGNSFRFSGLALESHSAMRVSDERFRLSSGCNELLKFCCISQVHGDAFVTLSR